MHELFPVIKAVLSSKVVIFTAIVVFLYLDFVCFVARYRKKKKLPPVKKSVAVAPAPEPAGESGDAGDEAGGADGGEGA